MSFKQKLFLSRLDNLRKEGKDDGQLYFVGNIMIDTLHYCLKKLASLPACQPASSAYAVCTLHRPSNVDNPETLGGILNALSTISQDLPIFFPIHPRTQKNIDSFGLSRVIESANIKTMPPQSYLDFLSLWKDAALVLTDSGGLQEETTALGIPCFTIRENTERPITIEEGTNVLVGTMSDGILAEYGKFRSGKRKTGRIPELWDGNTAGRIIEILFGEFR